MARKNTTIKDVAREAKVSVATVSRVLNDDETVKRANVDKVNKAIAKCNYVPNAVARKLKTSSSETIALIVSDISNGYYMAMAKYIESIIQVQGYSLILCGTDDCPKKELEILDRMMRARVDGIVLNTSGQNNEFVGKLSRQLPMVLIDRSIGNEYVGDFVGANNTQGVKEITEYLISMGHRKIGFINSSQKISTSIERSEGFHIAMKDAGIIEDDDSPYPLRYDAKSYCVTEGYIGCKRLFEKDDIPTAMVIANNTLAIGALKYMHEAGIKIPTDVSVITFGEIENNELFSTPLSYAKLNSEAIGGKAASCILERINNPEAKGRDIIFECSLVSKESVRSL